MCMAWNVCFMQATSTPRIQETICEHHIRQTKLRDPPTTKVLECASWLWNCIQNFAAPCRKLGHVPAIVLKDAAARKHTCGRVTCIRDDDVRASLIAPSSRH